MSSALEGRCTYFLERKRRTCAGPVKPGHLFCGNHLATARTRVPCPVDPQQCVADATRKL